MQGGEWNGEKWLLRYFKCDRDEESGNFRCLMGTNCTCVFLRHFLKRINRLWSAFSYLLADVFVSR